MVVKTKPEKGKIKLGQTFLVSQLDEPTLTTNTKSKDVGRVRLEHLEFPSCQLDFDQSCTFLESNQRK